MVFNEEHTLTPTHYCFECRKRYDLYFVCQEKWISFWAWLFVFFNQHERAHKIHMYNVYTPINNRPDEVETAYKCVEQCIWKNAHMVYYRITDYRLYTVVNWINTQIVDFLFIFWCFITDDAPCNLKYLHSCVHLCVHACMYRV